MNLYLILSIHTLVFQEEEVAIKRDLRRCSPFQFGICTQDFVTTQRTNNGIEGFHNALRYSAMQPHPDIWKVRSQLKNEELLATTIKLP